jgi:hypothetical protein
MRLVLTIALIGLFTSLSAQETITYPYNPDGDVDGAIGLPDLLDLFMVYRNDFSPTEIQIDGVGLLEVIQDLQNQIAAIPILDANFVGVTLEAHQQEIEALQAQNAALLQLITDNALPEGTLVGDMLRWNGTAWFPEASLLFDDNNLQDQ